MMTLLLARGCPNIRGYTWPLGPFGAGRAHVWSVRVSIRAFFHVRVLPPNGASYDLSGTPLGIDFLFPNNLN